MKLRIALVLRFRDPDGSADEFTVSEHNKVFREAGKVWLGKFGQPASSPILHLCEDSRVIVKLIISRAKKGSNDNGTRLFIASLQKATNTGRPSKNLIPAYYRKKADITSWFCLSSELAAMSKEEADNWLITSSGKPILTSLRRSSQTFFVATQIQDAIPAKALIDEVRRTHNWQPTSAVRPGKSADSGKWGSMIDSDEEHLYPSDDNGF